MKSLEKHLRIILVGILVSASLILAMPVAHAQGGLTLSPALQEVNILPSQTIAEGSFLAINNEDVAVTYDLSTVDMGALDDTGGIVFSGLSADYHEKYGLAKWLVLAAPQIIVPAKSSHEIKFQVVDDGNLSPGGHYGAIIIKNIFDIRPEKNQIGFDPQTAALLFVRKIGGEKVKLSLKNASQPNVVWAFPVRQVLTFQNEGNVHLVPRGVIDVRGPSNALISHGIINPESSLILPERTRNYISSLTSQHRFLWPGRYKIRVSYRYDGSDTFSSVSYSFWFYNLQFISITLISLFLLAVVVVRINHRYGKWLRPKIKNVVKLAILYLGRQKSYEKLEK